MNITISTIITTLFSFHCGTIIIILTITTPLVMVDRSTSTRTGIWFRMERHCIFTCFGTTVIVVSCGLGGRAATRGAAEPPAVTITADPAVVGALPVTGIRGSNNALL